MLKNLGVSLAIGLGIGLAVGLATRNLGTWVPVGIVLGTLVELVRSRTR